MKLIRKGKDLWIICTILSNGEPISLEGRNIRAELICPNREIIVPKIELKNNTLSFRFKGTEQQLIGYYMVTIYENYGETGQTVLDFCRAFQLISTTCRENDNYNGLDSEPNVTLEGNLITTMKGASAYDVAVDNGFKGSEEEWLQSLKQPAIDAAELVVLLDLRIKNIENTKVDKIEGKQLSTNDFTTSEKNKLSQLNNYDDSVIRQYITSLEEQNKLLKQQVATLLDYIDNTGFIVME